MELSDLGLRRGNRRNDGAALARCCAPVASIFPIGETPPGKTEVRFSPSWGERALRVGLRGRVFPRHSSTPATRLESGFAEGGSTPYFRPKSVQQSGTTSVPLSPLPRSPPDRAWSRRGPGAVSAATLNSTGTLYYLEATKPHWANYPRSCSRPTALSRTRTSRKAPREGVTSKGIECRVRARDHMEMR